MIRSWNAAKKAGVALAAPALVAIDHEKGNGPVLPSAETIKGGTYTPLSRPLFIYAKTTSLDKTEVLEFVKFYLNSSTAPALIDQVGYISFPTGCYGQGMQRLDARQAGTVFGGAVKLGANLSDLFSTTPVTPITSLRPQCRGSSARSAATTALRH